MKYEKQFPVLEPIHGVEVRIPLVGRIDEKLDFRNANAVLGEMLKNDAALRQQFGITEQFVKDNLLHKNGNVNGRAVANWLDGQDLVWHHHQDMRRLQLVKNPPHDPDVLRHTGGEAYIRGTIDELIKRGVIKAEQSRDGLTEALIQKARELGIIPSDFPW
ncbi:MAG TPA: HNH endonuclease [Gemmataceae bacterium]|nr:HNH endonuclease [Gemmataceae bacterium]